MSFEATRDAWTFAGNSPTLSEHAVLVLMALANRVNPKTAQLNPSISRLAKDCHCSERTVKRAVQELEDAGAIGVKRTSGGSVHNSNEYILFIPNGVPTGRGSDRTGRAQSTQGGPTVLGGGSDRPTKQSETGYEPAPQAAGVVHIRSRRILPELKPNDIEAGQQFFQALKAGKGA